MKSCLPLAFLVRQQELCHPPGEQQVFGDHRFFIGHVPIELDSRACEILQRFRLLVLLPRKFEITKTSRESLLAAYDRCLAHPTSSYTAPGASLNFAGRGCLWGAVRGCPLVKCTHVQLVIVFGLVLCTQISTTAAPQSRGVDLC